MHRPLNNRQERFVFEYLKDQNASAAAIRAGYSTRTKGTHAAALMRHPQVAERIRLALADMYAGLEITAINLLRQQARIAFFNPLKLFDATGKPLPLAELDPETASVLTVHYDDRASGEWMRRVRQPSRQQALAALERRYAQFLAMQTEEPEGMAQEQEEPPVPAMPKKKPVFASNFFDDRPRDARVAPARGAVAAEEAAGLRQSAVRGVAQGVDAPPAHADGLAAGAMDGSDEDAVVTPVHEAAPAAAVHMSSPPHSCSSTSSFTSSSAPSSTSSSTPSSASSATSSSTPSSAPSLPLGSAPDQVTCPPPVPAEEPYDFRKDPNWMWGGRVRPKPAPQPEPAQPVASLPPNFRVRAGAVVPAAYPPGYNPPWLRRDRPQYAETGSVFGDD